MIGKIIVIIVVAAVVCRQIRVYLKVKKPKEKIAKYHAINREIINLIVELENQWADEYMVVDYCAATQAKIAGFIDDLELYSFGDVDGVMARRNQLKKEISERLARPGDYFESQKLIPGSVLGN